MNVWNYFFGLYLVNGCLVKKFVFDVKCFDNIGFMVVRVELSLWFVIGKCGNKCDRLNKSCMRLC